MNTHFKNMMDNRTTANFKNVFITANWKPRKANVTCGWAQPLHSGDTQEEQGPQTRGDTGRRRGCSLLGQWGHILPTTSPFHTEPPSSSQTSQWGARPMQGLTGTKTGDGGRGRKGKDGKAGWSPGSSAVGGR